LDSLEFTVAQQSKIDSWIEGQILRIKNMGNIPYDGELRIYAEENNTLEGSRDINLDPSEETNFDLASMFPTGTYQIRVPLSNETFANVKVVRLPTFFEKLGNSISGITGGAVYGVKTAATSTIGIIFITLIVLALIAFGARTAIVRSSRKKVWERETQLATKRKTEIMREKGYIPSVSKKSAREDDEMKSFVQSLAKRAAEEPKPFKPVPKGEGTYINLHDEPKERGGSAFGSMFDF